MIISLENYPFNKRQYNTVKLLWVRSFSEIYNPLLAVKILKSLLDDGIQATLCMVGPDNDGSLFKTKKYAKELKVNVYFTGKLSKENWIELSKDYNIFINTTNFDNMPVSVIEAMALGLPVISTNVGGMPFLIENEHDGILVNPNKAKEFSEAIIKMLLDQEALNRMTLKAREKSVNYNWNSIKILWINLLK